VSFDLDPQGTLSDVVELCRNEGNEAVQVLTDVDKNETQLLAFVNRADTHVMVRESDETEEALASLKAITVLPYRLCHEPCLDEPCSDEPCSDERWVRGYQ